jgi:4-hydroxy-tetrahydrodipicolinate synthase
MTRPYAGTWTALITPFTENGEVDYEALKNLVQKQIKGGVTGVVPLGTTGESPTITPDEMRKVFETVVDIAKGKIKVMAGTGSNCTSHAVDQTKIAKETGVDACLVVCPYYNKPTQEGLRLHFLEIAKVGLPIIVYNIKGRTGINMTTDTLMKLAENEMIAGVKEASGDLAQMKEVIDRRPDHFTVLSGDDGLTLELIKLGGDGVVSVASNIIPREVSEMVNHARENRLEEAAKANDHLRAIFKNLFVETNPIPVKYCSHKMGLCGLNYRLPMCSPLDKSKNILNELMNSYNLSNQ